MKRSRRERWIPVVTALLCIFAFAMVGGTLTAIDVPEDGNDLGLISAPENNETTEPEQNITPDGGDGGVPRPGEDENQNERVPQTCVEELDSGLGLVAYLAASGLLFFLIYRLFNASVAVLSGYALTPILAVGYFVLTACPAPPGEGGGGGFGNRIIEGESPIPTPESSPLLLAGVFGIVIVGAAALYLSSRGEDSFEELDPDEDDGPDPEALARAAGRAADRLEERNADVDNEVYQAWYEMTRLLDVDNRTSATPGEFEAAAVDAGLNREHVGELTLLFEEVRYGHKEADSREQRAIDVFRTIEAEYTSDGGESEGSA